MKLLTHLGSLNKTNMLNVFVCVFLSELLMSHDNSGSGEISCLTYKIKTPS